MCLVIFKRKPIPGIKRFVLFNRDEQIKRKRTNLELHVNQKHNNRILCGVDVRTGGTWFGLNLDTGNLGFLTNYENKPTIPISNRKYKRASLLMNFLKEKERMSHADKFKEYLQMFLEEGEKFNGTNIWLSNIPEYNQVVFAHNQEPGENFTVLDEDDFYAFGTGDAKDSWEK